MAVTRRFPLIVALALGALAAAPLLLGAGFLNTRAGGDSPFLLFRLHQLHAALSEGVFPVRWMPDAAYGLGYPFFNYYAALPYYLAAAFKSFGFSYVASLKLTQLAGYLLAAGAMYAWARRHTRTPWGALLASAAYTFAPFHMVNIYVRGDSLSEFWAFAWYPLILLAADRLMARRAPARLAALALAYAGLLLTHNLSAFIFSPFLLLYLLLVGARKRNPQGCHSPQPRGRLRAYGACALALALGVMLAAWFWLPALGELNQVQLAPSTTGYFHYANHFRAGDLIQPALVFDYAVGDPAAGEMGETTPFAMSAPQALAGAAGGLALVFRLLRRFTRRGEAGDGAPGVGFALFLLVGAALSVFLITPASSFLWERVPGLPLVQFPWRFLSVASLFLAALAAYIPDLAFGIATPLRAAGPLIALVLSLALAASALAGLRLDFIPLNDHDITAERLQLYEYFSGNIGTTIRYEWLPNTVNPRPYSGPDLLGLEPRAKPLSGDAHGTRVGRGAAWQRWSVSVGSESATLALPLHYWPGWRAAADGRPVELSAAPGLGWAQLTLPRGAHVVTLWLDRTPVRALGEWLSLAAVGVTLVLLRPQAREALAGEAAAVQLRRGRRWALLALLAAGAVWVGLRLLPAEPPLTGPLNMDFARQAFPYHAPEGVDFGDGLRLAHYAQLPRTEPCGPLPAEMRWEGDASGVEVTAALTLAAANVLDVPLSVREGVSAPADSGGAALHNAPCPLSPGVYLPTLSVTRNGEALSALSSDGAPRGTLTLAPFVVNQRGVLSPRVPPGADFGEALSLLAVEGLRADSQASLLALVLRWRAEAELARNYHIGLRLRDVAGNLWAEQDAPLGLYGAYPPALWLPGELVAEVYGLPLPLGMPPGDDYRLAVSVYDAKRPAGSPTGEVLGRAELEGLSWRGSSPIPENTARLLSPIPALSIASVNLPAAPRESPAITQGRPFALHVQWIVESAPAADYRARWALIDAEGDTAWSAETPLAPGSPPTLWEAGAFVEGRLRLNPPAALAPGAYTLTLTLLDDDGAPLHAPAPVPLGDGQLEVLAAPVPTGEPADLPHRVDVDFGDVVRLWGYGATVDPATTAADTLTLTLAWGALAEIDADYTFFVHVFDPATETIVAQVDTMPHNYLHPTSAWIPGEIVTDTVTLDLGNAPPGVYWVAVGWGDENGRLPARDASGARLDGDRAILPLKVRVPGD